MGENEADTVKLRSDGLTWQRVDDEVVVLDLRSSTYLSINGSGAVLWALLEAGTTTDQLVELLQETYGLDEQTACRDADAFLAECQRLDFIA